MTFLHHVVGEYNNIILYLSSHNPVLK
jgi:hypothetical protein